MYNSFLLNSTLILQYLISLTRPMNLPVHFETIAQIPAFFIELPQIRFVKLAHV